MDSSRWGDAALHCIAVRLGQHLDCIPPFPCPCLLPPSLSAKRFPAWTQLPLPGPSPHLLQRYAQRLGAHGLLARTALLHVLLNLLLVAPAAAKAAGGVACATGAGIGENGVGCGWDGAGEQQAGRQAGTTPPPLPRFHPRQLPSAPPTHQGASTMCLRSRAAMNSSQVAARSTQASKSLRARAYMSACKRKRKERACVHCQPAALENWLRRVVRGQRADPLCPAHHWPQLAGEVPCHTTTPPPPLPHKHTLRKYPPASPAAARARGPPGCPRRTTPWRRCRAAPAWRTRPPCPWGPAPRAAGRPAVQKYGGGEGAGRVHAWVSGVRARAGEGCPPRPLLDVQVQGPAQAVKCTRQCSAVQFVAHPQLPEVVLPAGGVIVSPVAGHPQACATSSRAGTQEAGGVHKVTRGKRERAATQREGESERRGRTTHRCSHTASEGVGAAGAWLQHTKRAVGWQQLLAPHAASCTLRLAPVPPPPPLPPPTHPPAPLRAASISVALSLIAFCAASSILLLGMGMMTTCGGRKWLLRQR